MPIPTIEDYLKQPVHPERKEGGKKNTNKLHKKNTVDKPLVSIITVVFNDAVKLEKTILSVLSQTYGNIEYIVIDGGSTDETLDMLYKYNDKISYWISEPDKGISDAFNKGIQYSSGDWINFLNAGDIFTHKLVLDLLQSHFQNVHHSPIVSGFARFGTGTIPRFKRKNQESLDIKSRISHQASFIHKSLFQKLGIFDIDFKLRMDYEFWLRTLKHHHFIFIDEIIIDYEMNGVSSESPIKFCQEEIIANNRYIKNSLLINLRASIKCGMKIFLPNYK